MGRHSVVRLAADAGIAGGVLFVLGAAYGTTGRFRPVIDRGAFEELFVVPNQT